MKKASKSKLMSMWTLSESIADCIASSMRLMRKWQGAARAIGAIVMLGCLTGSQAQAATASLVKDINPTGNTQSFIQNFGTIGHNFSHTEFTLVGDTFYFVANDGVHGNELWKSDGTEAGTALVLDIDTGSSGFVSDITALGTKVYFIADDGIHGRELWQSNGTAAGTTMVSDVNVGPTGSTPASLTAVGDSIFWSANNGVNGVELWETDGTTTVMLADNPTGHSFPTDLIEFAGKLFYARHDGFGAANELWVSDGTEAGTGFVRGLPAASGEDGFLTLKTMRNVVGGFLYFVVKVNSSNDSLWRTGGTTATTVKVGNINSPGNIVSIGGNLIFTGKSTFTPQRLWRIVSGTNLSVEPVDDGNPAGGPIATDRLVKADNRVFFAGSSNVGSIRGLYETDGTSAGTRLVKVFPNGSALASPVAKLTAFQDKVIFVIADAEHGSELWISDGTSDGSVELANINTQPELFFGVDGSSNPDWLTVIGDTVYLSADDGISGKELWKINVNETPPNTEDRDFCVPIKTQNGAVALICL